MHILFFVVGVFLIVRKIIRQYFIFTSTNDDKRETAYSSEYDVHMEVNQPIYRFFYIVRIVMPFCFFAFCLVMFVWLSIAIMSPRFDVLVLPDWAIRIGQNIMQDVTKDIIGR